MPRKRLQGVAGTFARTGRTISHPPGLDESQLGFWLQSDFERRVGHYSTGVDRPTILPWAEISTSWPRPRGAREAAPGYSRR